MSPPEQPGIQRHQVTAPPVRVEARPDPAALARDIRVLSEYLTRLQRQLDRIQLTLTGRINQMLMSGTLAQRPAAGVQDRLYVATDQASGSRFYYDTGTAWLGT